MYHCLCYLGGTSYYAFLCVHQVLVFYCFYRPREKSRAEGKRRPISEMIYKILIKNNEGDFPGGTVVKNLPANAGDMGSSPGPGRSHMPQSN